MTCHWSIKGDADVDKSRVEEILSADAQQGIGEMDKMRAKTRCKVRAQKSRVQKKPEAVTYSCYRSGAPPCARITHQFRFIYTREF